MADKSFGVKELNLISASGTPTITSPNSVNINATNVAISTDITVGGMVSLGAGTSISSPGTNVLTFGTNSTEKVRIESDGQVVINRSSGAILTDSSSKLEVYNTTENHIFVANSTAAASQDAGIMFAPANNVYGGKIIVTSDEDFSTSANRTAHMAFYTRKDGTASEKLRITSDGNVNIGGEYSQTDSQVTIVDVSRPIAEATLNLQSSTTSGAADTGPVLRFYGHSGSEGRYHASIKGAKENGTSGNTAGYLAFNTRPAGGGAMAEAARFTSSGNLKFVAGQGVDFSSASGSNSGSSSALLDDYEEGVYTPTFTCSSGSITLSGSYNIICYEKIGSTCHVHGRVRVSSVSSPSGSLTLGLPFTRSNPGEDSARIGGTCVVQNGSGAVSNYLIHPTGATGVEIARGDTSSIDTTVADNFSGNELVYISVTYRTT